MLSTRDIFDSNIQKLKPKGLGKKKPPSRQWQRNKREQMWLREPDETWHFKENLIGLVVHACNCSTQETRQKDQEIKAILAPELVPGQCRLHKALFQETDRNGTTQVNSTWDLSNTDLIALCARHTPGQTTSYARNSQKMNSCILSVFSDQNRNGIRQEENLDIRKHIECELQS